MNILHILLSLQSFLCSLPGNISKVRTVNKVLKERAEHKQTEQVLTQVGNPPKHTTEMQKSARYPVRVQASCLGPGWVLFVSQILKEQAAFSVPKPADRQGALKAPNWARHRALKPTENSALWD